MALTGKQERFCEEYIIDFNGAGAYERAGYAVNSPDVAKVEAHHLLKKPLVARKVELLVEERRNRSALTADMVLDELRALAFWNMQDFVNDGNGIKNIKKLSRKTTVPIVGIKAKTKKYEDPLTGKIVTETEVELKMHDKRGALTDLGKHLGIFEKDNEQKGLKIKVTRK